VARHSPTALLHQLNTTPARECVVQCMDWRLVLAFYTSQRLRRQASKLLKRNDAKGALSCSFCPSIEELRCFLPRRNLGDDDQQDDNDLDISSSWENGAFGVLLVVSAHYALHRHVFRECVGKGIHTYLVVELT
jgi:hypothetical protein